MFAVSFFFFRLAPYLQQSDSKRDRAQRFSLYGQCDAANDNMMEMFDSMMKYIVCKHVVTQRSQSKSEDAVVD